MAVTTTGAIADEAQFLTGSISHFTLADTTTDASAAAYLDNAIKGIQGLATVVMIGTAAAGGWRFAIENNGTDAAALQAAVRSATGDADVTVVDFTY